MAKELRLGRTGLVIWLLSPVVLVGLLALMMDRSRARPDFSGAPVSLGANVSPGPARQPPGVQPESLPQGFVIVVEDRSKLASSSSPIYIGTNHNGWNPGDPGWKMTQRSDGRWQIALKKPTLDSRMGFKFTRGDWDHVEVAADGKDIDNRLLPLLDPSRIEAGAPPAIEFVVEKWIDQRTGAALGASADDAYAPIAVAGGRIVRIQTAGGGVPMQSRDLLVWLPPEYDDPASAERRYPVLYMHDGQNLFQKHAGIPAEWGVDETAVRLIKDGEVEPFIVVGIPNAGNERLSEYLPVKAMKDVEPRGEQYVEWILHEVMPRVERAVRVKTGPEDTAIGGSSLGGLISLYATVRHPETFGKVLIESPSLVLGGREIWKDVVGEAKVVPSRAFLAMGGSEAGDDVKGKSESQKLMQAATDLKQWLKERGGVGGAGSEQLLVIEDGAKHNESAWAARLPKAMKFLFPPRRR
jgi:predicted alpha/beta superfamily hydrolase